MKDSVRRGFGLVEAMMAVFVLSLLGLSLAYMFQYLTLVSVKTRQHSYSTRLAETIFAKLKTMEYYYIFDCDSALPSYGLTGTFGPVTAQKSSYPYRGVLDEIDAAARRYKVDRWTLTVRYKTRDVSDINGNGMTNDLRDFTDANGDKADDYDPSLKYHKANADSDHYDTYLSTAMNKTASEVPDTNLKEVEIKFYRNGSVIHSQKELVSLEMLSGLESRASGAELKLLLTRPANNAYLYDLSHPSRAAAFSLAISRPYPPDIVSYRADTSFPLSVTGETSPLAAVRFYHNSIGTVRDTVFATSLGGFDLWASGLTSALTEGENTIYAQAVKDSYYSPYAERKVLLDLNPPVISENAPTSSVGDLYPFVGAVLTDAVVSAGIPSGICEQVTALKVNGSPVPFNHDPATGVLQWTDEATGLPPRLTNGASYTVLAEAGDRAGYKAALTWNFSVSVGDTDHSAPSVANKTPIGGSVSDPLPEISCKVFDNQTGIILDSLVMKLDGVVVVSSANLSGHWNAKDGRLFYRPESAFANYSSHTVEVTASHWADNPADKKTTVEAWNFTISYWP